jgi:hypothetical protein
MHGPVRGGHISRKGQHEPASQSLDRALNGPFGSVWRPSEPPGDLGERESVVQPPDDNLPLVGRVCRGATFFGILDFRFWTMAFDKHPIGTQNRPLILCA